MPRHHLVAGDAFQNGVHDRPDGRRLIQAILCFGFGQTDGIGQADIYFQAVVFDEIRLQTMWPGLLMPEQVPPPRRKYIGG